MKYAPGLMVILLFTLQTHALSWRDLWLTPDQQAQIFMEKGNPSQAKDLFENKDWSATANYRTGNYQKAAKLFKEVNSQSGFYNRGNALAHLGQYEEAIKAYDKAIAMNPKDEDAIYNRKLVKELMKKDKQKQENQNQDEKNQEQDKNSKNDKSDKNKQNKENQNQDKQNQNNDNKGNKSKQEQPKPENKEEKQKQSQNKPEQQKQQDANKGNQKQKMDTLSQADKEKQQAKQHWLQLIPDDPGGLMREKFLRDHLRRERGWYQ